MLRPPSLAGDDSAIIDVLLDLDARLESEGRVADILLLVEPTCPLRKPAHLLQSVERLIHSESDSAVTVSRIPSQYHPDKAVTVSDLGLLGFHTAAGPEITSRQQLNSDLFYRNGACYALWRKTLVEKETLYGESCCAIVLEDPMVSIDTANDFTWAEFVMNRRCS